MKKLTIQYQKDNKERINSYVLSEYTLLLHWIKTIKRLDGSCFLLKTDCLDQCPPKKRVEVQYKRKNHRNMLSRCPTLLLAIINHYLFIIIILFCFSFTTALIKSTYCCYMHTHLDHLTFFIYPSTWPEKNVMSLIETVIFVINK